MVGDYLDIHESCRAQMIRRAEEAEERNRLSEVVRHATVVGSRQHEAFWAAVEAQRQQTRPRVRAFRR